MIALIKTKTIIAINSFWKNVHINNIKWLHCDRIDVSVGIDVSKTRASRESIIFHYFYFFDKAFKFQPVVYNDCHDLLIIPVNLNDIAILNIYSVNYRCIINEISKSKAVNLLKTSDLSKKGGPV